MDTPQRKAMSKYLSKHLRHIPQTLGLVLEVGGWIKIDTFLVAAAAHGFMLTRDQLEEVVRTNDKQRFAIDETGQFVRANQGHSVPVDLQLVPQIPPNRLYHGTAQHVLKLIMQSGLKPMRRHHVHLSISVDTAYHVGQRHGSPVVLEVDAARLAATGVPFWCSENGVWLVDNVPSNYLQVVDLA